jgi:alpha-amylase/alpha-mannosidase (GH57 family)
MTFTSNSTHTGEITGISSPMTTNGVYVTIHGHFYQPPRENPYLNAIERQPSAEPFHDWNERIHHECYRTNAFARIFNDLGEVTGIVNNYEYLSFNIGPTLMSWLEMHDVEVYQKIIEADRLSCARLNGHGNAIAQVYNHIILPLASDRDKRTQIRWGKADFKSRFGRDPEGMWLAETAIDPATLAALIAEEIKFIILAPSQVQRCRSIPTADNRDPEWHEVGGGQIDATRPYRCYLPGGRDSDYLDIFFYDGPISRDMGFNDVLESTQNLVGRVGSAVRGDHRPAQLITIATDGETFGHHKREKERCLAYAFVREFPKHGWTVTNFAHYLSEHPPTWECQLKPITAWSCFHGVDRWQDDCGCGGGGGWHQKWRRPLRNSLNWLRDRLSIIYETEGNRLFADPWKVRDEYIEVIRDRSPARIKAFFKRHQTHPLSESEKVDALRLLEMQRHSLLMFTSCGWFFEELSRPEGVQILRYAARAIELAGIVAGVDLEPQFIEQIAHAPSNVDTFKDGATIYQKLVKTAQIGLEQVAAHYAITSLFHAYPAQSQVYCYDLKQVDYQLQRLGSLSLAVGQIKLTSIVTWEKVHLVFAVLHLGGLDFHCCIQPFSSRLAYTQLKDKLFDTFRGASAAQTLLTIDHHMDGQSFGLNDLFAEEREQIMHVLNQETLRRLDRLYTQVYRENYGILAAFHQHAMPVPPELQVAAEIALSQRCLDAVRGLEREVGETIGDGGTLDQAYLNDLEAIATEANYLHCQLDIPEARKILERMIWRSLWHLLHEDDTATGTIQAQRIERSIALGEQLKLGLCLDRVQELYFSWLYGQAGRWSPGSQPPDPSAPIADLLNLASRLKVDISGI